MSGLSAISDNALDMLITSYDNELNELEIRKEACEEAERKALSEDDYKQVDDEDVDTGRAIPTPTKRWLDNCSVGYTSYPSTASTRGSMIWTSLNKSSYTTIRTRRQRRR